MVRLRHSLGLARCAGASLALWLDIELEVDLSLLACHGVLDPLEVSLCHETVLVEVVLDVFLRDEHPDMALASVDHRLVLDVGLHFTFA